MHRFFGLMALTAAGLGLYLLFGPDDAAAPKGASAQRFTTSCDRFVAGDGSLCA